MRSCKMQVEEEDVAAPPTLDCDLVDVGATITTPEDPPHLLQTSPTCDLSLYELAQREPFFGRHGPVVVQRNRTRKRQCRDMTEV